MTAGGHHATLPPLTSYLSDSACRINAGSGVRAADYSEREPDDLPTLDDAFGRASRSHSEYSAVRTQLPAFIRQAVWISRKIGCKWG